MVIRIEIGDSGSNLEEPVSFIVSANAICIVAVHPPTPNSEVIPLSIGRPFRLARKKSRTSTKREQDTVLQ